MTRPRDIADSINRIDSSAADATAVTIDANENVGIGTTSISSLGTGITTLELKGNSASQTDRSGGIRFTRHDGSDGMYIYNADGASYIESRSTYPLLITTNGTERMRITSGGDVGVGTTTPSSDISGTATVVEIADSNCASIALNNTGASTKFEIASLAADAMTFRDNGTERIRLTSGGELGINTTSNANYSQTSGDSSLYYRTGVGSLIQAQDADDAFSMIYMNKFDWSSGKDRRYINWYKNGSSISSIELNSGGTQVVYGTGSDYRLKENVADMTGGITRIKSLNPKRFSYIDDADSTLHDGFLAHELDTVVPEAVAGTHNEVRSYTNVIRYANGEVLAQNVSEADWTAGKLSTTDDDGNTVEPLYPSDSTWATSYDEPVYQQVDLSKLTPLLTQALQEAIAKIEALETRVAALEA